MEKNVRYMDLEQRAHPEISVPYGQTRKETVPSGGGVRLERRAEDRLQVWSPNAVYPLTRSETKQLFGKLERLTEANSELEAFNVTVSHDLCTPLTTINGYCQVLKEICRDQLDEPSQKYLEGIYEGTLRMKELISSMLEFSRVTRTKLHRERVDLSALAHQVARELRLAAPDRTVTFKIAKGITGNSDPALMRSVLDNLVGNAWKFSAGRPDTVIEFGRKLLAGKPVFFVRDNGPGFDMALADQLFEPFRRLPGTGVAGQGIGLATVDRIIRRLGGRIWAESKPGAGASFLFTLE